MAFFGVSNLDMHVLKIGFYNSGDGSNAPAVLERLSGWLIDPAVLPAYSAVFTPLANPLLSRWSLPILWHLSKKPLMSLYVGQECSASGTGVGDWSTSLASPKVS